MKPNKGKNKQNKKNLKEALKDYFFIHPTEKKRVRQLERETLLPLPSAIRYCKELEKECFIRSEKLAGMAVYSADRTSKKFLLEKKLFNVRRLFELGIVNWFISEYDSPALIVFGSFSKGEDVEGSDIDIYLETPIKQSKDLRFLEKKIGKTLHIHKYKSISSMENKELANNILNGVILNGFIEVFR
ncbi:MAG: nucleotidyltransferase domain-containing protein [archaeon]